MKNDVNRQRNSGRQSGWLRRDYLSGVVTVATVGLVGCLRFENSSSSTEQSGTSGPETTTDSGDQITGQVVSSTGAPVPQSTIAATPTGGSAAGEWYKTQTGESGKFNLSTPVESDVILGFYQVMDEDMESKSFEIREGTDPYPRDGVPDVFTIGLVSYTEQLGSVQLPNAHPVSIRVQDESNTPVQNATVNIVHRSENGYGVGLFDQTTNEEGLLDIKSVDGPGINLTGDISLTVRPPSAESEFIEQEYEQTFSIDGQEEVNFTLEA
jgi:hypothetical protein